MQIIPDEMLPGRDPASLKKFFEGCRDVARTKHHYQIASISLAVKHIAPLAVLQSIYEENELHFYVERASSDEAVAGAEAVVQGTFDGPDRFQKIKAFADEVLENTVVIGDLSEPFAGPHFFSAVAFKDSVEEGSPFASTTTFLPRWQVSKSEGRYGAVANLRIDEATDLDAEIARVWSAYSKFDSFDYAGSELAQDLEQPTVIHRTEISEKPYTMAVSEALNRIRSGAYEKVVLARGIRLEADRNWEPLVALNQLKSTFSGCYCFSFGLGNGRSFIGATPERLLKVHRGELRTEAIAGSAPRGGSAREDARFARGLLESEKDIWEHRCVCYSILRRLDQVGLVGTAASAPRLLPLANVQHLHTPITSQVGENVHILDVAEVLHPTPAVGGTPREDALADIRELEGIDRGLYAGVVGWFNHLNDGEMLVGIRSALIAGETATLYAGAGIVKGSDPKKETEETEMKLRALLGALTG